MKQPDPPTLVQLIRRYGELQYISGHEMALLGVRQKLGAGVEADRTICQAERDAANKAYEALIDGLNAVLP